MKQLNCIYLIIMLLATIFSANADSKPAKKQLFERYEKQLETAVSARDSVRILYYLFDLSDRKGQVQLAWDIYYTAGRAENSTAQLDMLRTLGAFYSTNDSVIALLLKYTDGIQNEASRAATKTFILNQQISRKSRQPGDTELQRMLLDSIKHSHNLKGNDIYDKISLLYQIIQYLGVDADGVLFKECLDRYAELMDKLPGSDYPLKNQFYTTAAMIHSRMNGNTEKAIEYDRKLLEIIDQLQQMYRKKKREFRNYDVNKFVSYRRMMSNYKALSPEEIEIIHDSLQALYERDPDVKKTMDQNGQAFAYYYMASKDYNKAIPALKAALKNPDLSAYQKQKINSMLIEAAKETGDNATYIRSMENYILHSYQVDSLRKVTMRREQMVRDSILTAPLLYNDMQEEGRRQVSTFEKSDTGLMIVSVVLAMLLAVYIFLYVRLRLKKTK